MGVVAAMSLLVAACGGDDDSGSAAGTDAEAASSTSKSSQDSGIGGTSGANTSVAGTDTTAPGSVDEVDADAELRFAIGYSFPGLDPHRTPAATSFMPWMRPVYDSLLGVDRDSDTLELAPQLATSWQVAKDGLNIEFELRDDVVFQDGTKFDASAVKANLERAMDDESTVASILETLDRVDVIDETHVVFRLSQPDPGLLWAMATESVGFMVSPSAFESDLNAAPVGSGPFVLVSAVTDGDAVYERWDEHWDPSAAQVQQIVMSSIAENSTRYNGLRSGGFDAAYLAPPLDIEAKSLEQEGYHYVPALSSFAYGVLLNSDLPPLDDVRVRRAISLALNRQEIAAELLGDESLAVAQAFTPGYLGHDDTLGLPYDPDEAQRLVQDAGAEGATLTFIQQAAAPNDQMAQVVQQALGDIGLNVELEPFAAQEARPAFLEGDHHGLVALIGGRPDPDAWLQNSYLGTDNPAEPPAELVEMADAARAMPLGSADREAAYQDISAYLLENPIHLPIGQWLNVIVAGPHATGAETLMPRAGQLNMLDFRGVGIAAS